MSRIALQNSLKQIRAVYMWMPARQWLIAPTNLGNDNVNSSRLWYARDEQRLYRFCRYCCYPFPPPLENLCAKVGPMCAEFQARCKQGLSGGVQVRHREASRGCAADGIRPNHQRAGPKSIQSIETCNSTSPRAKSSMDSR